jgi:hypothetical protein
MTFIKFLKMCDKIRKRGGQSIVEYALLVGVAIIALLATNFLVNNF